MLIIKENSLSNLHKRKMILKNVATINANTEKQAGYESGRTLRYANDLLTLQTSSTVQWKKRTKR